jgi:hypothetical protein
VQKWGIGGTVFIGIISVNRKGCIRMGCNPKAPQLIGVVANRSIHFFP